MVVYLYFELCKEDGESWILLNENVFDDLYSCMGNVWGILMLILVCFFDFNKLYGVYCDVWW